VRQLVQAVVPIRIRILPIVVSFVLDLHQDLNRGLNVVEHGKAVELEETLLFLFKLFLTKAVNLNENGG
jgi:hypothetical protein